jgi:hypothetical protein
MTYFANLQEDLPSSWHRKRVIFYQQGIKIYGLLPYILNRKLKAQFFSNSFSALGGRMSVGSFEANWTAVPYGQSRANIDALLDWLYSDKGFKVAIATPECWNDDIFSANMWKMPPHTWFPVGNEAREGFLNVIERPESGRDSVMMLLALPAGKRDTMEEE